MTTFALKAIDRAGGIDNYIVALDEASGDCRLYKLFFTPSYIKLKCKAARTYSNLLRFFFPVYDYQTVNRSPYIYKMRAIIATSLYHDGKLLKQTIKKLGFDINPPPPLVRGDVDGV